MPPPHAPRYFEDRKIMIIPMLPDAYAPHKIIYPVLVQPYLTGIRALYQDGAFQPNGELRGAALCLKDIFPPKTVLDGVITRDRYIVFDVVSYKIPYKERFDTIVQILNDTKPRHPVKCILTRKVFDEEQASDQFKYWCEEEDYPGMIYRLGHCFYTKATSKNKLNVNKQLLLRKCENSTPTPTKSKEIESKSPSTPQTNHAGFTTAL